MANVSGTISLDDIVKQTLWKAELPESKERLFSQLAIQGYREIRLFDGERGIEVAKSTINSSTESLNYPSDCVKIIDVFLPLNGKLWSLSRDHDIITTTSSGTLDPDWGEGVTIRSGSINDYSQKGGVNDGGYFNLDEENRVIIFRNLLVTDVILYYISTGVDTDGSTLIPKEYQAQIEGFIMKEYTKFSKPNLYTLHLKSYESERDRVRYLANVPSLEQWKDWIYRTYSGTVQR